MKLILMIFTYVSLCYSYGKGFNEQLLHWIMWLHRTKHTDIYSFDSRAALLIEQNSIIYNTLFRWVECMILNNHTLLSLFVGFKASIFSWKNFLELMYRLFFKHRYNAKRYNKQTHTQESTRSRNFDRKMDRRRRRRKRRKEVKIEKKTKQTSI